MKVGRPRLIRLDDLPGWHADYDMLMQFSMDDLRLLATASSVKPKRTKREMAHDIIDNGQGTISVRAELVIE